MKLGAFSISLNVDDIQKSFKFYSALGFTQIGGDVEQGWVILRNDNSTIGLFQGMFEKNMLTFNPGWAQDCSELPEFTDVRDIQRLLQVQGITPETSVDPQNSEGPANIVVIDPDGNPILIDQHR